MGGEDAAGDGCWDRDDVGDAVGEYDPVDEGVLDDVGVGVYDEEPVEDGVGVYDAELDDEDVDELDTNAEAEAVDVLLAEAVDVADAVADAEADGDTEDVTEVEAVADGDVDCVGVALTGDDDGVRDGLRRR